MLAAVSTDISFNIFSEKFTLIMKQVIGEEINNYLRKSLNFTREIDSPFKKRILASQIDLNSLIGKNT
jgi:hypothetical protein